MNEQERKQVERAAKAGFTLMEVMIAVMIVGVMSALAVTGVMRYLESSRKTATQQQLVTISTALKMYQSEHKNKLPESLDELTKTENDDDEPLIESGNLNDAWGNEIRMIKKGRRFQLRSNGPDGEPDTDDDIFDKELK